jgi:putative tryptophan/tyrosine transport system substrate-binding protein
VLGAKREADCVRESEMKRREFITLLGGSSASVVWSLPLGAQRGGTAARLPRIGYLTLSPISDKPSPERVAFLQGLRELGYIEGKTIQIEYSSAESYPELLPEAAEALVEQGVDLIAATGVAPALAAKQATQSIPVVFTYVSDPVGNGLVASLARPEGNVTGLSAMQPELAGKKVELLKEVLPALSRVAALWTSAHPAHMRELEEAQAAARRLAVSVEPYDVTRLTNLERAFADIKSDRPHAILTFFDYRTLAYRGMIAEFAVNQRLPTIFSSRLFVDAGGFMSYGPDAEESFHSVARYVDRVLRGAKPSDLPVEQPTRFELVVNLKIATILGINIPPSVLLRVDRMI